MRGLIHFIVAIIISSVVLPIGLIYSLGKRLLESIDAYLYSVAYHINVLSTYVCADLYNDTLLKKGKNKPFLFGIKYVSVSYHVGQNFILNTLSKSGKILNKILNLIEKDHTLKAIQKNNNV